MLQLSCYLIDEGRAHLRMSQLSCTWGLAKQAPIHRRRGSYAHFHFISKIGFTLSLSTQLPIVIQSGSRFLKRKSMVVFLMKFLTLLTIFLLFRLCFFLFRFCGFSFLYLLISKVQFFSHQALLLFYFNSLCLSILCVERKKLKTTPIQILISTRLRLSSFFQILV